MRGQQRGMVLESAEPRGIQDRLRHEQKHVSHHAHVGIERLHEFERFGCLPALGLMDSQTLLDCEQLERILRAARLVRRAADCDHVFLPLQQFFQDGLSEGFLPVHDNTHHLLRIDRLLD